MKSMQSALRWLADHAPNRCAVCRIGTQGVDEGVCARCTDRFAPPGVVRCPLCAMRAPRCDLPCGACLREPPAWSHAVAAFDYGYPWDSLIARFKFHDALELAHPLSRLLGAAVNDAMLPRPQLLVPMPLSAQRLRKRGFNQAWEITRLLARSMNTPAGTPIRRITDAVHQSALPRDLRAGNVRGAFAVPATDRSVQGKCIALIDDVMTTGATMAEAARTLLQSGASQVQVWVLARTPSD